MTIERVGTDMQNVGAEVAASAADFADDDLAAQPPITETVQPPQIHVTLPVTRAIRRTEIVAGSSARRRHLGEKAITIADKYANQVTFLALQRRIFMR